MSFLEFRQQFFELGCFDIHQIHSCETTFDDANLGRWVQKGYLIRLRQGGYVFREYLNTPDFNFYVANRIYRPSYISLHTVLAFYGIIPEAVSQITSVSTLKTASFHNAFGEYNYKTIKPALMFGYIPKPMTNRSFLMATPEKALLDLLYLYPFYTTEQDLLELRLDDDFLHTELNVTRLNDYCTRFNSTALRKRVQLLLKTYNL